MGRATENHVGFVREALERDGYTVANAHFLVGGTAGPDEGFAVGEPYGYDEWEYDRQAALTVTGNGLTGQNTVMFIGDRSVDTAFIFGPDADLLGRVIPSPGHWLDEDEDEDD